MEGDLGMARVKGTEPKVAYIYKETYDGDGIPTGNGTWHPIAGLASTNVDYTWSGTHTFSGHQIIAQSGILVKEGINNFLNPAARDSAIPSPTDGLICFVRKDALGAFINDFQYYYNSAWVSLKQVTLDSATSYTDTAITNSKKTIDTNAQTGTSYTLALADAGKMITTSNSSSNTVTIPPNASVAFANGTRIDIVQLGSGQTTIAGGSGVTINSKGGKLKIYGQYSAATIIKLATNTWALIGDLAS